jgi:hypothetical protein
MNKKIAQLLPFWTPGGARAHSARAARAVSGSEVSTTHNNSEEDQPKVAPMEVEREILKVVFFFVVVVFLNPTGF